MTQRLLLLLPSMTYRADAFISACRRLPVEVDVVTATDGEVTLPDGGPRGALSVPFDPDRGLPPLLDYARHHPVSAVIGVDDDAQLFAAVAAEALGAPHSPVAAVAGTLDKLRQMRTLAAAGLPTPQLMHRAVLKPRRGRASQGVVRLPDDVFVQAYVPWAAEVAVEGCLGEGGMQALAIFDKPDPLEGPLFEETVYVTPSRLPAGDRARVTALAAQACAALGLTHGAVHVELRIDPEGGVWLIEVNPRSIGGRCSAALRFAGDLTLEDLLVRRALALEAPTEPTLEGASAVAMLAPPAAGHLGAVKGQDEALAVDGVQSVEISVPLGAPVEPLPDGDRYVGFVVAGGVDPAQAEAAVRAAVASLTIEVS